MPKIKVLDKQVAELIAAGEVVERPSSVIKELVENSVDSGASVITVEIRNGGITFMRVTDNGCGIPAEDVPTAFLRHATSKIAVEDDLYSIGTLGFRGEALASISAVARVELLTKARGEETGVRYVGGGSEEYTLDEAGCPEGTTLIIRDIFFNTPARMKFLKKDSTEGNSIAGMLDKIALSHPEISFRFIRDGKEQLHTPGDNKLSSAVYAVYGKAFTETMIPVDYEFNQINVTGYVSAPSGSRPNRSMQSFFINGRFIRSRTAGAALEEAYKGSIMVGKFPACVLHLKLSFEAVDVNVHPAKLEVRFVNERPIFDAVYHAVKSALNAGDKTKVMSFKKPAPPPFAPVDKPEQIALPKQEPLPVRHEAFQTSWPESKPQARSHSFRDSASPVQKKIPFHSYLDEVLDREPLPVSPPLADSTDLQEPAPPVPEEMPVMEPIIPSAVEPAEPQEPQAPQIHAGVIGEAFGTYLIIQYGPDELMLIDKHAAHERLLYERLKVEETGGEAQTLLEPVPVTLDKNEYTAVLGHLEELSKVGFEIDDFGAGTVLVRTAPLLMDGGDAASAVMELAGYLASFKTDLTTEHMDWVYHNVACRAAMKAGDVTSKEELIALAVRLEQNPQVRYCPHGRPVYILIRRRDLERQFGRV